MTGPSKAIMVPWIPGSDTGAITRGPIACEKYNRIVAVTSEWCYGWVGPVDRAWAPWLAAPPTSAFGHTARE
jgi:hypothetical protein